MEKNPSANAGDTWFDSGLGGSPGKEMATYSSIVAWKIPWTVELYHLVPGYRPWVHKELDMTEHAYTWQEIFLLSGEKLAIAKSDESDILLFKKTDWEPNFLK